MDKLLFDSVCFPIKNGFFSRFRDSSGIWCWGLEINCGESAQLNYQDWPDDREEQELDWVSGTEISLSAQMLPIPADSPDALLGRAFSFPQSPADDPAEWDRGVGWLFFLLSIWESHLVFPATLAFIERREQQYRVKFEGYLPANNTSYKLGVETWLDWRPAG